MNKRITSFGPGFTIVELLIVVVVIAILASITIVAYSGITKRAVTATLQSDLKNAATAMLVAHQNGESITTFPNSVKPSSNVTLSLTETSDTSTFCINATSTRQTDVRYHYHSASGMAENLCSGDVMPNTAVGDTSNIPTVLAYDMFTRADSATTLGTSPSGHAWTAAQGTWGISNNRARSISAVDGDRVSMNVGTKDFTASIRFYGVGASRYPALIFRVSGNTFYLIEEQRGEGIIGFKRIVNGNFSDLYFTSSGTYHEGDLLSVTIKEAGDGNSTQITASLNGSQFMSHTDTSGGRPQGTGVGFRHGAGPAGLLVFFDSLQVSAAP